MGYNQRVRVLVVDDEPSICRALTIAFTRAGYDVRAVESGEVAHTLIRSEHFDCLVVDLRIPDMRGDVLFELAASLQPHLKHRTIFTTGDASERAQELIDACDCRVLPKPFDLNELLAIVEGLTKRAATA
ncbi:MAG: response regulator [Gemmatimonadaceae bacterium]|nr:response regulator [Gemmatimonadaceae bacterium]